MLQNPAVFDQRTSNVIFRKITFNEMPEFNTMGFRPYTANPNTREVTERVVDRMAENMFNVKRFSPTTIGYMTNDVIALSGANTGYVAIDNGWQTKRYSFSILVEVQMTSGGSTYYVVSGFTDTNEILIQNSNVFISPDIVLHITNINSGVANNMGNQGGLNIVAADQVLTKNHYLNDLRVQGNEFRSQRPLDVTSTMASNMYRANTDAVFINAATSLPTPQLGKRINNIPTNYASNLFNSYIEASEVNMETDPSGYFPEPGELSHTSSIKENYFSDNKFLTYLGRNDISATNQASFKWRDLAAIDQHIMDRVHVNTANDRLNLFRGSGFALPSNGLITANTANRSDITGQIVATLSTSIPALAIKCQLSSIMFIANNNMGQHVVQTQSCTAYSPVFQKRGSDMFENLLPTYLLNTLFTQMDLTYELLVFCHTETETFIKISINGGPYEDFLFPTYADALVTPLVTNDHNTIDTISSTVNNISTVLAEEASSSRLSHTRSVMLDNISPKNSGDNSTVNSIF
jgi:hypothetical protein